MTTNLLELADTVTKDTQDTVLEEAIRKNVEEIRKALQEGHDYILKAPGGREIIIRAKRMAKRA